MKIGGTIYLDHQATTPLDTRVLAEMSPYFGESFGNPHSGDHAFGWRAAQAVELAAGRVARMIGADSDEIIFTSGATEANNLALLGLARRASGGARRRILLGATEHKCVLATGRVLEEQLGFRVEHLPVDVEGRIRPETLNETMDESVLAVSVMAVNNEIGTIADISGIGTLARRFGAIFHCDAAQAPCAIDLKDSIEHIDLLSLSGHKIYGPKGVGVLFARRDLHGSIEPIIYGGGQQHNLRSGTVPTPLCVGMGVAAGFLEDGQGPAERETVARLRHNFVEGLMKLPWPLRVNGPAPGPERHPGNVNVCFEGFVAHDILGSVQPWLAASTGSACTTGAPEPSHVLRAIGLSEREAESCIRFSFGRYTTESDVSEALCIIEDVLADLAESHLIQKA